MTAHSLQIVIAPRNRWFIAAGVLSGLAGILHLTLTNSAMAPLHASGAPVRVLALMDVIWQSVSVTLIGSAAVLLIAAGRPAWRGPVALVIAGWFSAGALLFVGFGVSWFGDVIQLPHWIGFVVIAVLLVTGTLRDRT